MAIIPSLADVDILVSPGTASGSYFEITGNINANSYVASNSFEVRDGSYVSTLFGDDLIQVGSAASTTSILRVLSAGLITMDEGQERCLSFRGTLRDKISDSSDPCWGFSSHLSAGWCAADSPSSRHGWRSERCRRCRLPPRPSCPVRSRASTGCGTPRHSRSVGSFRESYWPSSTGAC